MEIKETWRGFTIGITEVYLVLNLQRDQHALTVGDNNVLESVLPEVPLSFSSSSLQS